jgi:peptide/nickel transport system permease protein
MPLSIHSSASAELAPVVPSRGPEVPWRPTVAAVVASASGKVGLALTVLMLGTAVLGPALTSVDPFALTGTSLAPPSGAHPMGTDALGRDLFSGVLYGARTSVLVAASVAAVALLCGLAIGMLSGYRGGWIDDLLMRLTELVQVMPRFVLVVVAVALFGPGVDRVVLTLGLTSWPVLARVVRGEVLAMRQLDFVRAAEATGAPVTRILRRELMPNVMPGALVMVGLLFGQVLLIDASLGFLGLGDPGVLSWGVLAGQAQGFLRVAWWLPVFPGMAVTLAVLGPNLLADALSSARGGR